DLVFKLEVFISSHRWHINRAWRDIGCRPVPFVCRSVPFIFPRLFTQPFTQARFSKLKNARKPCVLLFCSSAVRSTPERGHLRCTQRCPLCAKSGHHDASACLNA